MTFLTLLHCRRDGPMQVIQISSVKVALKNPKRTQNANAYVGVWETTLVPFIPGYHLPETISSLGENTWSPWHRKFYSHQGLGDRVVEWTLKLGYCFLKFSAQNRGVVAEKPAFSPAPEGMLCFTYSFCLVKQGVCPVPDWQFQGDSPVSAKFIFTTIKRSYFYLIDLVSGGKGRKASRLKI